MRKEMQKQFSHEFEEETHNSSCLNPGENESQRTFIQS